MERDGPWRSHPRARAGGRRGGARPAAVPSAEAEDLRGHHAHAGGDPSAPTPRRRRRAATLFSPVGTRASRRGAGRLGRPESRFGTEPDGDGARSAAHAAALPVRARVFARAPRRRRPAFELAMLLSPGGTGGGVWTTRVRTRAGTRSRRWTVSSPMTKKTQDARRRGGADGAPPAAAAVVAPPSPPPPTARRRACAGEPFGDRGGRPDVRERGRGRRPALPGRASERVSTGASLVARASARGRNARSARRGQPAARADSVAAPRVIPSRRRRGRRPRRDGREQGTERLPADALPRALSGRRSEREGPWPAAGAGGALVDVDGDRRGGP